LKLRVMSIKVNKLKNKQKKQYEMFYLTGNSNTSTASETS
jgi:hypothetical protein